MKGNQTESNGIKRNQKELDELNTNPIILNWGIKVINCTCEMESFCDTFYELIIDINNAHKEISTEFHLEKKDDLINLKRKQINHVTHINEENTFSVDSLFLQLISNYREELLLYSAYTDLQNKYKELILRLRTKETTSIVNKLKYYLVGKKEEGKIPINKCLNDLLGFRIHPTFFDHNKNCFQKTCQQLKQIYNNRIDFMDSSKGDYKAFHIYLYGEEWKYFPWEIQIWCLKDRTQNDLSHKDHKQEHKKWAEIYKNSTEIELEMEGV
ncbi:MULTISPECIES: hypothetical protein [Bacillus amyloliquefaciens group]|uniref:hypothetical protein n=1 Tax=Bacillus amyloliquefaciens group TaxID=1938374 RepID=UPI0004AE1435|nr:hypothetical protein [Bacillus velezensis]MCY0088600.1 hypothetical protein [Bacillus velezensis]MEC0406132.1 hypothetical protein [Bacillus velezensis]